MFFIASIAILILGACSKDAHNKPNISFKTGQGYVYKDTVIPRNTPIVLGCDIKKTEDDLKTYNFSIGYDGGGLSTRNSHNMTGSSEKSGFSKDEPMTTRNQAGKEVYEFSVTDADGNFASIQLTVTVN